MLKELFIKKKYATITVPRQQILETTDQKKYMENKNITSIDKNSSTCKKCGSAVNKRRLKDNLHVCPLCGFHNRIGALDRINMMLDNGTFIEYDKNLKTLNPLDYEGYEDKVEKSCAASGINEAVVTGEGLINGERVAVGVMDSGYIMGSMGSVVGEKLTRLAEKSLDENMPLIIFCASGGARMQEGILSLMQMAKVSAALKKLSDAGILYISVLTDPTTGGVTASFAMLGDIIIAEPGAQIGFAGKRVIEQTMKQKVPDGFQTSEFLLEHGFVDMIIERQELKPIISKIIKLHGRAVK